MKNIPRTTDVHLVVIMKIVNLYLKMRLSSKCIIVIYSLLFVSGNRKAKVKINQLASGAP